MEAGTVLDRHAAPAVSFGPFSFDPRNRILSRDGAELALPPRVVGVLELLLARAGEVVSRQALLDAVWKDAFVTDTSLAEAVSVLRQALGDDPQSPRYVQTVHRRGYRFVAPVAGPIRAARAAAPAEPPVQPSIGGVLAPWSIAVLCAAAAAAAIWQIARRPAPEPPPVVRFDLRLPPGTRFDRRGPALAISRDGHTLAWSACDGTACGLYVRAVDRLDPVRIAGTDGATSPFFSPDGRWLGFFAGAKLRKVSIAGGSPVTLADAPEPGGASWGDDGHIVFAGASAGGLALAFDQGGEIAPLTAPRVADGEWRHVWPTWMPDGRTILFTVAISPLADAPGRIAALSLPGRTWKTVAQSASRALFAAPGYLVLTRGTDLQALTFDPRTLAATGPADTVLDRLMTAGGAGAVAIGATGAMSAVQSPPAARRLSWQDDPAHPLADAIARLDQLALSPDGRRAAGVLADGARADVWIADLDRESLTRVTSSGVNVAPVWSPDGAALLFASSSGGPFSIMARATGTGAAPTAVASAAGHAFPWSIDRTGTTAVVCAGGSGRTAIAVVPRGGRTIACASPSADEAAPALSPDGEWLAYQSDEAGRWEVYVRRTRDRQAIAVSADGGTSPSWSADGRAIFFHDGARLLRASFTAAAPPAVSRTEVVFDAAGARLLIADETSPPGTAVVVLGWTRELQQRLPLPVSSPR
jgi:DNA-binding winged helix-turn-helix (wHTH) protein